MLSMRKLLKPGGSIALGAIHFFSNFDHSVPPKIVVIVLMMRKLNTVAHNFHHMATQAKTCYKEGITQL